MKRVKFKLEQKRKNHTTYADSLEVLIDLIFEEAYKQKLTWAELARLSQLSYATIRSLGNRETLYPQYRTVQLLATAVGGEVMFKRGRTGRNSYHVTWTPKVFAA